MQHVLIAAEMHWTRDLDALPPLLPPGAICSLQPNLQSYSVKAAVLFDITFRLSIWLLTVHSSVVVSLVTPMLYATRISGRIQCKGR